MADWARISNLHAHTYTSAGVVVGTVTSILDWNYNEVIDGAGQWNMTVHALPANQSAIAEGYRCYIYGTINSVEKELTIGYITGITPTIDIGATTFNIQGEDRIGELRRRIIPSLQVKELAWFELAGYGAVRQIKNLYGINTDVALSNTYDGTAATSNACEISNVILPPTEPGGYWRYIYVGFDARFEKIKIDFKTVDSTGTSNGLLAQYFSNNGGWTSLAITSDGTKVGAVTFKQDGDIEFTMPTDWARNTPTQAAGNWFWVRLYTNTRVTASVDIYSITVDADQATTAALNQIMAYAPAGWQTSGYAATGTAAYISYNGETVLQALEVLREQIGGHYRANLVTGTMQLEWYDAFTASGVTAGEALPGTASVRATNITRRTDLGELITHIYPTDGDDNTLAETTLDFFIGPYVFDVGSNLIWNGDSFTTYGMYERAIKFDDLKSQQPDSYIKHPQLAADALFVRATNYLAQYDTVKTYYDVSATGFATRLRPGYTIHVDGTAIVSGGTVVNISETLNVVGIYNTLDDAGWLAAEIEVTDAQRQAVRDANIIAERIGITTPTGTTSNASAYSVTYNNSNPSGDMITDGMVQYASGLMPIVNGVGYTGYAFVPLNARATSNAWDGDLYDVDNDGTTIDLQAAAPGFALPAGIRAVAVALTGRCATAGKYLTLGYDASNVGAVSVRSQVTNLWIDSSGIVPCDANGDIYFETDAVHGAEFAAFLRIYGYFI
jgi:hypothetical protein